MELVLFLLLYYAIKMFYFYGIPALDEDGKLEYKWWRQFECLSWPEDLLTIVCMIFHENTEEWRKKRHQIARYLNLVEAGTVSSNYLAVFTNEMKRYRTSFRKLFCHDWVCVPLVYTQVAALATYSFFVFCLLGRQHFDSDDEFDTVFPIFTVVQFLFYVGWFKVGQDLMRPFGLDDDDIELSYILDRNLVISFAIVDCLQADQPPEFEPDVYWRHLEDLSFYRDSTSLKFGRIDLSRTAHKHPPKLHTYVQVRRDEKKAPSIRVYRNAVNANGVDPELITVSIHGM
ncbi:Bestrophin [Ancylostoma ceylanicum]|uniref:Bestrophin homolog n=1 Tax=Ancylostoma ceylanicum TaxID=53326 RepID=A0A0D6L7V9_9BILA|nr:Bestrophin [Ancylostoma ceylanicum]